METNTTMPILLAGAKGPNALMQYIFLLYFLEISLISRDNDIKRVIISIF
jgi:hypothetical protein